MSVATPTKQTPPPNFKPAVPLPDCCGTCAEFKDRGAEYDDSPVGCYKHKTPPAFGFESLCDSYERSDFYK